MLEKVSLCYRFNFDQIVKDIAYIYCQDFINYFFTIELDFLKIKYFLSTQVPDLKRYYLQHNNIRGVRLSGVGVGPPFHPSVPSSVPSSVHPSSSSGKKKMMEESTTIKKLVSVS
jgi:hypothetical protein